MSTAEFVRRLPVVLRPDPGRVVVRPFVPSVEPRDLNRLEQSRSQRIVGGVLGFGAAELDAALERVLVDFTGRHADVEAVFRARFDALDPALTAGRTVSEAQKLLIGSYFSHEYSFMAAALFNPSIVAHPDQSGTRAGSVRFLMSLRAVGEGHISSITFRTGTFAEPGEITLDPPSAHVAAPMVAAVGNDGAEIVCHDEDVSGCVIFPVTPAQRNGLEDVRMVRFVESDGSSVYYGTYTAYSGQAIRSELMTTRDFRRFTLSAMTGDATRNKGMALFPKRVGGRYAMLGRQDNESIFYLTSDRIDHWDGGVRVLRPRYPWEFVQMGNCGPPIAIDEGWLVLTHGVGPVRNYAIGACLLDRDDPTKLLARTPQPLIRPDGHEREGYVPNVTYSCGAMAVGRTLLLPYALADSLTTFASIPLGPLLASME